MTTLDVALKISKSDSCYQCHGSASLHIKNPFGLYWSDFQSSTGRVHRDWVDMMTEDKSQYNYCGDYVNVTGEILDHDMLFKYMSS